MNFEYGSYGYIARSDLEVAVKLKEMFPKVSVQYAQQACEKIMKQYIMEQESAQDVTNIMKSHKLKRIAAFIQLPELNQYGEELSDLSEYYFDGRYPGVDYIEPTADTACTLSEAASCIMRIVECAIEKLREERAKDDFSITIIEE